jgi:mRNA interferase YafQ
MYKITTTNRFEKEVRICIKRGYDISLLKNVMELLAESGTLPPKFKPHKLSGNYNNCWECHIKPDWLLIWQQNDTELILLFMNTGTHSDLF